MPMGIDKHAFVISFDSFLFFCLLLIIIFPSPVNSLEVLVRHGPIILFSLLIPAIKFFLELVLFLHFVKSGVYYSMTCYE